MGTGLPIPRGEPPAQPVSPYFLRHITAAYPHHVWGIDIPYIRLAAGGLYLVAVLAGHTRYVVAWALDQTLEVGFVLEAVERAVALGCPTLWNRDQGRHFTRPQDRGVLEERGIPISMDGQGRALDHIVVERLWRTVQDEEVSLQSSGTPRAARQGLTRYVQFYNQERPHQALGDRTPAALSFGTSSEANAGGDVKEGEELRFCDLAPVWVP